jgi:hypothetical protein
MTLFPPFLRGNEASFPQQGPPRPVRADQPQRRLPVAAIEPLPVPQPTDLSVRPPSHRGGFPVGPSAGAYHSHHYGPPFSSHPSSAPSHHLVRASPSVASSLSPSPTGGGLRSSPYDSLSLTGHGAADLGHRYNHQRNSNDLASSKSHHHAFPSHTAGVGVVLAPSSSQAASPTGRGGSSSSSGGGGAPQRHLLTGAASQQQPAQQLATRPVHTCGGYSSPSRQSTASSQLGQSGGSHHIASLLPSGRHVPSSTLRPPGPPEASSSRYDSLSAPSALQQQQQYVTSQSRAATVAGSSPSGPGRLSISSSISSSSQPVYSSPSGPATSESSSQQPPAASKAGGQTVGASGISPISLEQRINKVISQNQAIVETLGNGYY